MAHVLTMKCGVSEMPVIAMGTGGAQSAPGAVGSAIEHALTAGYRHIDCALLYRNEKEVGEALTRVFDAGTVRREEVFVTGKLWSTYHRHDKVSEGCAKTLADLQLDYLDLYLIHSPMHMDPDFLMTPWDNPPTASVPDPQNPSLAETWAAMEKLVEEGRCRNIGLSNFTTAQIDEVLKTARIRPACLQVESHPHLPNLELLEYCKREGIAFVAYSPLTSPGKRPDEPSLLENEQVRKIAQKHNVSPAQLLIRYQIDKGNGVIVKSVTPARIKENLAVTGFSLSPGEVSQLSALADTLPPGQGRCCDWGRFRNHPLYPFEA